MQFYFRVSLREALSSTIALPAKWRLNELRIDAAEGEKVKRKAASAAASVQLD